MGYTGSEKNNADKARWQREWRKKNPDLSRKSWKDWENKNEYKSSGERHRIRTFKLTEDKIQEFLEKQKGICPICKEPPNSKNPFVPDHDHSCCPGRKSCGKCVRGLIHRTCNAAIGLLKDDPKILREAAKYLENSDVSKK